MANEIKLKKWNGSAWVQQYPEVRHTDIVASGTPSSSNFLRGDGAWANVGDGNTKFYAWRAINNTSSSGAGYYRIANVNSAQSSRFQIELVGRENSYGNGSLPNYAKILGQLNNDDNYDVWWFNNETGTSQVVSEVGIVDDGTTAVNIWVKVGQYAEVSATAYISDGTITTYDTDSLTTSAPTNYSGAITEYKMWNSGNDGSGSGLAADTVDGIHGGSFLRSDTDDSASGVLTFNGQTNFNAKVTIDTGASTDALVLKGTSPTISFSDDSSSADDFFLHANGNNFYVLADRDGGDQVGAGYETPHPLQLEADTNIGYLFGERLVTSWTTYNNSTDVDTIKTSGMWRMGTNTNLPSTTYHYGQLFVSHGGDTSAQIAVDYNGPNMAFRGASNSGGWQDWHTVWNSGNDGSGSGLDADTVDGIEAGSFLRSNADDIYTGTLTLGTNTTIKLPNSASYGIRTSTGHRVIDSVDATLRIGDTGKHSLITLHGQDGDDFRVYYGNTHYNIFHQGNDGAGSGLDADLLDGQQGSYYTGYTDTAIANLVDSSPDALNTLNELASALGDDANFSTTVTNSLAGKLSKTGNDTMSGDLTLSNSNPVLILTDTDTSGSAYVDYQAGTSLKVHAGADNLTFVAGNAERARISSGGSFGVGTTNPHERATITQNNARSDVSLHRDGNNLTTSEEVGRISFDADYNSSPIGYAHIIGKSNSLSSVRGSLDFKVKSTSGNLLTGMTLYGTNDGARLGVGTETPSEVFETVGNIKASSSGNANIYAQRTSGANVNIQSQASRGVIGTDSNHDLQLKTNATAHMTIDTSGNTVLNGNLTLEDHFLNVGDVSGDNYTRVEHIGDNFGFDFQHNNASSIQNLQGSTNQALVLGDVSKDNSATLLGASILSSGTWTKYLNLTGEGDLYVGSGATDKVLTEATGSKVYKWTVSNIHYVNNGGVEAGYKKIMDISTSDQLGVGGILYATGTSNSVVINAKFEILVNHSADIVIKSISGGYTQAYLKIQSNNNEHCEFLFARERDDTNDTPVDFTFIPFRDEDTITTHTNNPTASYGSNSNLTHLTKAFSEFINATGGGESDLFIQDMMQVDEIRITDTNTKIVEGSGNSVRMQTNSGYIDIGPNNTGWGHIQTDRGRFYFNKGADFDGDVRMYSNNTTKMEESTGYIYELGNRVLTTASTIDADTLGGVAIGSLLQKTGGTMTGDINFSDDGEGIGFYGDNAIKKVSGTGMVITTDSTRALDILLQLERGAGGTKYKVFHEGYKPALNTSLIETATSSNTAVDISGFSSINAIVVLRARQFGIAVGTYIGKINDITTSSLYKQELYKGSTRFVQYYRSSTQILFSSFASSVSVDCYEIEVE